MFTDIRAAIEEARWLRQQTKHHHVVTQKETASYRLGRRSACRERHYSESHLVRVMTAINTQYYRR